MFIFPFLIAVFVFLNSALILQRLYNKAIIQKKILTYRDFLEVSSFIALWIIGIYTIWQMIYYQ
jgi:hypothetical protein